MNLIDDKFCLYEQFYSLKRKLLLNAWLMLFFFFCKYTKSYNIYMFDLVLRHSTAIPRDIHAPRKACVVGLRVTSS